VTVEAGKDVTASDLQAHPHGTDLRHRDPERCGPAATSNSVYIAGTSYAALSDNAGAFTISSVPVGTYTVYASMQG